MKLVILNKAMMVFLLVLLASPAIAHTGPATTPETPETRVVHLQNRLEEIKTIDRETLSRGERKALRREVREIKKELAAIGGGVYLSVGALILIALLLILLL